MARLRFTITMSLDGYVAGPDQSLEHPLGRGGGALHRWAFATRTFCAMHGLEGGETGLDDEVVARSRENIGATLMGRHMFGGPEGPWGDDPWNGWWGEDPPFHTPVVVVTHHPREPLALGDTTFSFATGGIEAALEQAREAAGARDVALGGGGQVARQYLRAGLVDEMEIHVVPVLLGGGARLFEDTGGAQTRFECVETVSSPAVTHHRYRLRG